MKRSQIVVKFQATDYRGVPELLSIEKCSFVKVGAAQQTGIDQHPFLALLLHRDISAGRMHLYLAFLFHRDYFHRSDASLSRSFVPQRLFPPAECISIFLFFTTGIISTARIHPCLAFLFHRDYFHWPDASLACSFVPQGLFCPTGCIPSLLFCSTGIISTGQMHPYLPLLLHRDYFHRSDTSPHR